MTSPSYRERIIDSLCDALDQVGADPNDGYWYDYNVDRFSVVGKQSTYPKVTVTTRGEDGSFETHGFLTRSLGIEVVLEMSHNVRAEPGNPPEDETDRYLDRGITDIERALLRWVHLDPLELGVVQQSLAWDRDDPLTGTRLETAATIFLTIGYKHSAIDPRSQVYDAGELV